jgi:hypothetical protein
LEKEHYFNETYMQNSVDLYVNGSITPNQTRKIDGNFSNGGNFDGKTKNSSKDDNVSMSLPEPITEADSIKFSLNVSNSESPLNETKRHENLTSSSSYSSNDKMSYFDLSFRCPGVYSSVKKFKPYIIPRIKRPKKSNRKLIEYPERNRSIIGCSEQKSKENKYSNIIARRILYSQQNISSGSQHIMKKKRYITMIIILKGQLGNHLSFVAYAYAIKRSMERKYMIDQQEKRRQDDSRNNVTSEQPFQNITQHDDDELIIQIVGEHFVQYHPRVLEELQTCFPNFFESFYADSGKWSKNDIYIMRKQQQQSWLLDIRDNIQQPTKINKNLPSINELSFVRGNLSSNCKISLDANTMECWQEQYCLLEAMLQQQKNFPDKSYNSSFEMTDDWILDSRKISLPFLTTHGMEYTAALDEYYDELRELFWFNETACCGDQNYNDTNHHYPYDDEVVVHIRRYRKEILRMGFHEMDPVQMAYELFAQYHKTATTLRIALVSIGPVDDYENALRSVGFTHIRRIRGSNGMEDFCFLQRTKHHMIGMKMSTFASWAGYLSNATKVRLYAMDSKYTKRLASFMNHQPFYNEQLKNRVQYETYFDNFTIKS